MIAFPYHFVVDPRSVEREKDSEELKAIDNDSSLTAFEMGVSLSLPNLAQIPRA